MNAVCRHFGECGGCQYQDQTYEQQLARKHAALQELFQELWPYPIPLIPSPVAWHYRNKVDPSFALKRYPEPPPEGFQRDTVLGFKRRGRWFWPMDIAECRIGPAGLDTLLAGVRAWRQDAGMRAYDGRKHTGCLRHLLVRDGKRSGERMVVVITAPGPLEEADAFVESVRTSFDATSIYHGEFSGKGDVAIAERLTLLYGRDSITETLLVDDEPDAGAAPAPTPEAFIADDRRDVRPLHFRISPMSFFQTNPLAAERLYGLVRAWAAETAPDCIFDLYGGAGGIAFSCAGLVREIISVENVTSASEDGRHNAHNNDIENVFFITDSVRNYLRGRVEGGGLPENSAVVVDPPRAGMHPKAIRRLAALRPKRLLYVSCNPGRLRAEAPEFLDDYRLTTLTAVDMFPHTPHVEVVAAFEAGS